MCRGSFVFGERRIGIDDALDGTLEQHKNHHNTEDLKTVARHVHHNAVHRDLLGRGDGDFPRFLYLKRVGFFWFLGAGLLLLLLALYYFILVPCIHSVSTWWM
jgi:hypothetical protein